MRVCRAARTRVIRFERDFRFYRGKKAVFILKKPYTGACAHVTLTACGVRSDLPYLRQSRIVYCRVRVLSCGAA